MVTPEQLELTVLSAIDSLAALDTVKELGIDDASFAIEEYSNVWDYYNKRAHKGEFPTREDVKAVCGVDLLKGITDKSTPVMELVEQTLRRKTTAAIQDAAPRLRIAPETAIRQLIGDLSDITKGSVGHTSYYDGDASRRLAEVKRRIDSRNRGEFIGIPTGLTVFDDNGDTWRPGEVITIMGTTNVGKSWLMCYFSAYSYYFANTKVLFLSPEDTNFEIEARLDPIIARFMGMELSNRQIRNGSIDQQAYEEYLNQLMLSGRKDMIIRDSGDTGVFTISDIVALSREHQPQMLCIDGFHLIRGVGKTWENMKEAAEQIKGLAQHMGMVVIAGTQATRDAALAIDDTPGIGQAAYGMGLMEASNRVISLVEKRGNKKQRIFKVEKVRSGSEKITSRQYLDFDVDIGKIRQLNPDIDDGSGEVDFG